MEMEGVEQPGAGLPAVVPLPESLKQEQNQHHNQQQPTGKPSPVVSEVHPLPSPAPAGQQNGVAPGAQQHGHSSAPSPATRSGTPLSHPSHPSTPTVVNGHPPMLPLPKIADASLSASATAAVNAVASANINNAARVSKEHLRWRDPITLTQHHQTGLQMQYSQIPHPHQQVQQQHQAQHQQQQQQHHHYQQQQQQSDRLPPLTQQHPAPAPRQPPAPLPPLHHFHAAPPVSSQPSQPLPSSARLAVHGVSSIANKPIIMDPPSRRANAQTSSPRSSGFASPTPDYARINPKFNDDCQRMVFAVQQSLPESVRRVIRDNWEKCLLGSEFHQAFILNASIHHALPSITRRAVRDFGRKMVTESREELIDHFTVADLDTVADRIIAKASDSFLDKCLEKRLLTIEAKPLINALAKAERLGYDPNDIVQEDHHERVIPQEAYPGAASATAPTFSQQPPSQPPQSYSPANPTTQCGRCFRTFTYPSSHDYHMRKNVCSVQPPTSEGFKHSCGPCGQGFTTMEELQAHADSRICGGYPMKTPRGPGRPPRAVLTPQANPVAILPSMTQAPAPNGYQVPQPQPQPQSTPTQVHSVSRRAASVVATPTGSPNPADPYAHLTPEELTKMNAELADAEAKYAPRFKEAENFPDENQRRVKIEGLRNSFGTKQSMIRKKYGVRLRERRTKAEIQAEKERLGIKRAERAEREKARASMGATVGVISSPAVNLEPSVRPVGASGWVAANTPRATNVWEEHDAKRRRNDEAGGYHASYHAEDTPTRKVLSVDQIGGGLSGSATNAATHDPTLPPSSRPPPSQPALSLPTKVYEEAGARAQIHEPTKPPATASEQPSPISSGTPNGDSQQESMALQPSGTHPIKLDDSSGSSDDEDIPPTLPPQIRQRSLPRGGAVMS